jgi:hypothetical protein
VVVVTSPDHFEQRLAVRETWGSYAYTPAHNVSLVFLLGGGWFQSNSTSTLQQRIEEEEDKYRQVWGLNILLGTSSTHGTR